jgi:hypothetical protein
VVGGGALVVVTVVLVVGVEVVGAVVLDAGPVVAGPTVVDVLLTAPLDVGLVEVVVGALGSRALVREPC